jgi:hypothetical protein
MTPRAAAERAFKRVEAIFAKYPTDPRRGSARCRSASTSGRLRLERNTAARPPPDPRPDVDELPSASSMARHLPMRYRRPEPKKSCGRTLAEDLRWVRAALARLTGKGEPWAIGNRPSPEQRS